MTIVKTQSGSKYFFQKTEKGMMVEIHTDNGIFEDKVIDGSLIIEKGKSIQFKFFNKGVEELWVSNTPVTSIEEV